MFTNFEEFEENIEYFELGFKMLSDMGQLMKDPLNTLYGALSYLDDPQKKEDAIAVIKHSFHSLVRLSENQIAMAEAVDHAETVPVAITSYIKDMLASANETLGDIGVTVELSAENDGGQCCGIHAPKFTQIFMLLISRAAQEAGRDSTLSVDIRFDGAMCYVSIPVSGISLYDTPSYLADAGTPNALNALENLALAKIINSFNNIHDSRVFVSGGKDGRDKVVIALKTDTRSVVGVPEPSFPGLRPDLVFLSDILGKESYR
ncbi:MAG: hypothetical protein FWG36_09070 [Oscillospiraceae bacterium]|nr:hypothetical protein [Oscillospiraceae bacterium]